MTVFFWPKIKSYLLIGKQLWPKAKKFCSILLTAFPRKLIKLYQVSLSPDHSTIGKRFFPYGYCKFYPSCSEYAHQSLERYGLFRGLMKALGRLIRCNPWHKGGIDLP
ncbi:MAG: membrane protein insertion efficiency factor YidD [Candidatus Abawacabacteria bacterium]|nr:membrane protein insertion efficiency factor YidD [Candidatus Abawacabacteria bacterium]